MRLFFTKTNKNNKLSIAIESFSIFSIINFVNADLMFVQEMVPSDEEPQQTSKLSIILPATIGTLVIFLVLAMAITHYCKKTIELPIPHAAKPDL